MQSQQTLTYAQLEGLWIQNGGSKATAPIAAAIALAESSGRSWITSSNPDGGTNVGPWQLDTKGKGAGYSVAQLQDPNTNAAVAVQASGNGTDWSAWETYVTGAYKAYMNNGTTPSTSGIGSPSSAAAGSATSASPDCMLTLPNVNLVVTSVGGNCLMSYSQARALLSGTMLAAAGVLTLAGLIILVAAGFQRSGALGTAADAAAVVPGAGWAARGLTAAHGRVNRTGAQA
jgi:hypothetical protein